MFTKTTIISLLAIAVLALGGIGYSAFTSSVTVTGSASAGSLSLYFYTDSSTSGANAVCTWSGSTGSGGDNTLTLTVTNLSPGDYCTATAYIGDTGTLPATSETTNIAGSGGTFCSTGTTTNCIDVTDSFGVNCLTSSYSATGSTPIPANNAGSIPDTLTVYLPSGSTLQSTAGTFTYTITGSVGS